MITLNQPHVPPLQHAGLLEAIALLSDPVGAEKLLGELRRAADIANAAITEAKGKQADILAREQALQAAVAQHESNKQAHVELLKESGARLDQREAEILRASQAKSEALSARESTLAQSIEAHDRRAAAFLDKVKQLQAEARLLLPA